MAEQTYISSADLWDATDASGKPIVAYSTNGVRATEAQLQQVLDNYGKGQQTEGFTVLPVGSFPEVLRRGFEAVNQPIQRAAQAEDQSMLSAANTVRGWLGKAPVEGATPAYENITSQIDTPGKAGATAALLGATAATGGMSGVVPPLVRGLAAGVGFGASEAATGAMNSSKDIVKPLLVASFTAGTEGAMGVIKSAFGSSIGQRAQQAVAGKIMDLMKEQYPALARTGADGLEAIASTPQGLQRFVQAGISVLRDETDDLVKTFVPQLNQTVPFTLGKVPQKHIEQQLQIYQKAVHGWLDHVGDSKAQQVYRDMADAAQDEVVAILSKAYQNKAGVANQTVLKNTQQFFQEYAERAKGLMGGAEVLALLKESGAQTGFNARAFQNAVANRLKDNPQALGAQDTLLNQAASAGFRGGLPGAPIDKNIFMGFNKMPGIHPLLRQFIPNRLGVNVGKSYGNVKADFTSTPADIAVINEYLKRE